MHLFFKQRQNMSQNLSMEEATLHLEILKKLHVVNRLDRRKQLNNGGWGQEGYALLSPAFHPCLLIFTAFNKSKHVLSLCWSTKNNN